jgi:hypothetical protein
MGARQRAAFMASDFAREVMGASSPPTTKQQWEEIHMLRRKLANFGWLLWALVRPMPTTPVGGVFDIGESLAFSEDPHEGEMVTVWFGGHGRPARAVGGCTDCEDDRREPPSAPSPSPMLAAAGGSGQLSHALKRQGWAGRAG